MESNGLEYAPLAVRVFSATSASLFVFGAVSNLIKSFSSLRYTIGIVSLYAALFGVMAVMCEFSPYGLNLLLTAIPFIGEYRARGMLYVAIGLLYLGSEMSLLGRIGAILMMISGTFNIVMHYIGPLQPMALGYDDANAPASRSVLRFEDRDAEDSAGDYDQIA